MDNRYYWKNQNLILHLLVKPGAKKDTVVGWHGDALKIQIKAPPTNGKANEYLIRFLSELFDTPQNQITLIRGQRQHQKWVQIIAPRRLLEGIKTE